jgi:hypothetical protein
MCGVSEDACTQRTIPTDDRTLMTHALACQKAYCSCRGPWSTHLTVCQFPAAAHTAATQPTPAAPPPHQLLTGVRILRLWRVLRMVSGFYRGAYLAGEGGRGRVAAGGRSMCVWGGGRNAGVVVEHRRQGLGCGASQAVCNPCISCATVRALRCSCWGVESSHQPASILTDERIVLCCAAKAACVSRVGHGTSSGAPLRVDHGKPVFDQPSVPSRFHMRCCSLPLLLPQVTLPAGLALWGRCISCPSPSVLRCTSMCWPACGT